MPRALQVVAADGEGDVGRFVVRRRLDNHVDVDGRPRQRTENGGGNTGVIDDFAKRNTGFVR